MNISAKITKLRTIMSIHQMDAYIIPSSDYHQSEYVGEHFKAREFITGFTGSAGTAVITQTTAGLWTDGRYFIQAEQELQGSGITLYRMGEPNVPTIAQFLADQLTEHTTLGFDGRVISLKTGEDLEHQLADKHIRIAYEQDLISFLWSDRPPLSRQPIFELDTCFSGETFSSKLARVRERMHSEKATMHLLTSLDDLAWLLNLRGNDIQYSPLFLAYALITETQLHLFIDHSRMSEVLQQKLHAQDVLFHPYNDIYEFLSELDCDETILLDPGKINYALYHSLPAQLKKISAPNPTTLMKAMKNDVEIENLRRSHLKDGIAMTKFMYWLKTTIGKEEITECSAAQKIEELRSAQDGFLSPSFESICAFKEHAAICHYSSTEETDCVLHTGALFLTDTGGHYYEGSTDITRTFALGKVDDTLKEHFTAVARSMIQLARAKFLYGCNGSNLDILAREPLWELGLDYNHGTGHGVGYLLNVHEGPCAFRWRFLGNTTPLEEGMVITDEPGLYIEGSHGIRTENELLIRNAEKTDYGQFMDFEVLTLVPIDLDALLPERLEAKERNWLNAYHQRVFETISPHLTDEETAWLQIYTRAI